MVTYRWIPRECRSKRRNFIKIRRNLITKIPLQPYSSAEFIKVVPQFLFTDLIPYRRIIQYFFQNFNFRITQRSVAKVKNRFPNKSNLLNGYCLCYCLVPVTLIFCNSSRIEINSASWGVRS